MPFLSCQDLTVQQERSSAEETAPRATLNANVQPLTIDRLGNEPETQVGKEFILLTVPVE